VVNQPKPGVGRATHFFDTLATCAAYFSFSLLEIGSVAACSEELDGTYLYAWCLGRVSMKTGMTLVHLVSEKQSYGAPYTYSMK